MVVDVVHDVDLSGTVDDILLHRVQSCGILLQPHSFFADGAQPGHQSVGVEGPYAGKQCFEFFCTMQLSIEVVYMNN